MPKAEHVLPTSRRHVLGQLAQAGAGLSAAAMLPLPAQANDADTRLLELDRIAERHHGWEGLERPIAENDPRIAVYEERWTEALAELVETPASTLAGIAAKVKWCVRDQFEGGTEFADDLARGLLADLARLTGQPVPFVDGLTGGPAHA